MTTEKQIHWMGEAVQALIGFGFIYVVIRMTEGASHKPTFAMSPLFRVAGLLLLTALAATYRTQRYYRKRNRRQPGQ